MYGAENPQSISRPPVQPEPEVIVIDDSDDPDASHSTTTDRSKQSGSEPKRPSSNLPFKQRGTRKKARRVLPDEDAQSTLHNTHSDSDFEFPYTRMYAQQPPSRGSVLGHAIEADSDVEEEIVEAASSKGERAQRHATDSSQLLLRPLLEKEGQLETTQCGITQVSTTAWRPRPSTLELLTAAPLKGDRTNSFWSEDMEDQPVFKVAEWPANIIHLASSYNPLEIDFSSRKPFLEGKCGCVGDCRNGTCSNAQDYIFCDSSCCPFGGSCSNGTRQHGALQLAKVTGPDEFTVIATQNIQQGIVLGEYLGELFYEEGRGLKRGNNEGYRVHFKGDKGQWGSTKVGIDARTKGSLMRFMNHSCTASARFYEHSNGLRRAIVVVTTTKIPAGDEVTVNYGNDLWFTCRCQLCHTQGG